MDPTVSRRVGKVKENAFEVIVVDRSGIKGFSGWPDKELLEVLSILDARGRIVAKLGLQLGDWRVYDGTEDWNDKLSYFGKRIDGLGKRRRYSRDFNM